MKAAEAATPTRSPDNAWAQLTGENTEEIAKEIGDLERTQTELTVAIAALERRIEAGGDRYVRDASLELTEKRDLREKQAELKRVEAAIVRLNARMEKGVDSRTESRASLERFADTTGLEIVDPTLDLSAKHLGNQDVAEYYAEYHVGFQGHSLMFQLPGKDIHDKRGQLTVGPDLTDADFFVKNGGHELVIVFTTVSGSHKTLKLEDGVYRGFYDSDAAGKPKSPESD